MKSPVRSIRMAGGVITTAIAIERRTMAIIRAAMIKTSIAVAVNILHQEMAIVITVVTRVEDKSPSNDTLFIVNLFSKIQFDLSKNQQNQPTSHRKVNFVHGIIIFFKKNY